jgi:glycosyltransferase involved in cell wall biosynthesis
MNILLIPATDWLRHPVPSRHHHIFEILAETDNVHVLQFDLFPENISRETRVILHQVYTTPSKGLASYYLLNMFSYWKKIANVIKSERIDVAVVSNLIPGVPSLLGNQLGCRIVFDLKDMFSDNSAIYYKNYLLSSIVKGTSEWLLQRLLKGANHVITVSMFLFDYVRQIRLNGVSLITNGADLNIFKPNLRAEELDLGLKENLEESKVVGFVGTVDRWIDFETVLASLRELSSRMNDVKLLVVGGRMVTEYFDEITSMVNRIGLQDRVIFTGVIPHTHVPYYINLMDVCLIPFRADLRLNQARCPDKLFEYLACGKPVVSTRLSEVLRIGQGSIRFYDDTSSLTRTLSDILEDVVLQDYMKKEALDIAKNYDWRTITRKYRETLEKELAL